MEFRNLTPFPAISFEALDQRDIRFHTVVMRITFNVQPDGTLAFAEEQTPLLASDLYYGEPNLSSVRQESDFAPYKPFTDVLVNAHAHVPGGHALEQFLTGIEIKRASIVPNLPPRPHGMNQFTPPSDAQLSAWAKQCKVAQQQAQSEAVVLSKILLVSGPRLWRYRHRLLRTLAAFSLHAWGLSRARPIMALPLRYEVSYGGENKVVADSAHARRVPKQHRLPAKGSGASEAHTVIAHSVHVGNPVGIGWIEPWYLNTVRCKRIIAPQLTYPQDQVRAHEPAHRCRPAGFGVVGRAWQPRLAFAGTYEQQWLDERHPYLPADFDFRYWNGAPEDQQVHPHLAGDETVTLFNMCPPKTPGAIHDANGNTHLTFRLPGHLPFVLVRFADGQLGELAADLDTLTIEAESAPSSSEFAVQVVCIWRATVASTPAVRVLEARMISNRDVVSMRAASTGATNISIPVH